MGEKKYEVSRVFKSAKEAFVVLEDLPQPICAIIYGDSGDINPSTYREIVREIKHTIPVMFEISMVQLAEEKFEEGRNAILKFVPQTGGSSGDLHQVITNLRAKNQKGSLVGVCVKSQDTLPVGYSTSSAHGLDYTITIR